MKIVYVSDLHFEINGLGNGLKKFEDGDILVLAGDISSAYCLRPLMNDSNSRGVKKAWEYMKREVFPNYQRVFKVMGNHTHYFHVYKNSYQVMKDFLSDVPNFQILENEVSIVGGLKFLGCTLWTNFNNDNPQAKYNAARGMNDYQLIYEKAFEELNDYDKACYGWKKPLITPDFTLERHRESIAFLERELAKQDELGVVVITHHCPTYKSLDPYYGVENNFLNYAYASDLSEMILDNQQILAWIHGHTHHNMSYQVGETWVLSNQCGYHDQRCYRKFKPNHYMKVSADGKKIEEVSK